MTSAPVVYNDMKQFERCFRKVEEHGCFCADLHVHSSRSDGLHSAKKLAQQCRKAKFIIAITDHNTEPDLEGLSDSELSKIIPAIEITSSEWVDILCYFYTWTALHEFYLTIVNPYKKTPYSIALSADEILCSLSERKCVVTIPHPDCPSGRLRSNFIKLLENQKISPRAMEAIDCIEVFNSSRDTRPSKVKMVLAAALKKHMVAGSDAHTVSAAGNAITYCKADNFADFLAKLSAGKVNSIAIPSRLGDKTLPKLKMAWLHVKGLLDKE